MLLFYAVAIEIFEISRLIHCPIGTQVHKYPHWKTLLLLFFKQLLGTPQDYIPNSRRRLILCFGRLNSTTTSRSFNTCDVDNKTALVILKQNLPRQTRHVTQGQFVFFYLILFIYLFWWRRCFFQWMKWYYFFFKDYIVQMLTFTGYSLSKTHSEELHHLSIWSLVTKDPVHFV